MTEKKRAIALGFFDGVHIGHAALLQKAKERAAEIGAMPSVFSFDVHPDNLVFGVQVPLINSAKGREAIIRDYFDISDVVLIHFNRTVMRMDWRDFADEIIEKFNVRWIVVGHDFRFGYKGQGTAARLKAYCEERNIGCDIILPVMLDGRIVSSTYIRELISNGDVETANRFLGHPHTLYDTVHSGYHLGTKIGAPTINMFFPPEVLVPKHGVYATQVKLDSGGAYMAVTNVGTRPTVADGKDISVESHLINFSGDLYGHQVSVEFYSFLRPEQKFDSFAHLSKQIRKDTDNTKAYFQQKKKTKP